MVPLCVTAAGSASDPSPVPPFCAPIDTARLLLRPLQIGFEPADREAEGATTHTYAASQAKRVRILLPNVHRIYQRKSEPPSTALIKAPGTANQRVVCRAMDVSMTGCALLLRSLRPAMARPGSPRRFNLKRRWSTANRRRNRQQPSV